MHNHTPDPPARRELRAGAEGGIVLVFTSSLDSTHRLCRLLQLCALASSPSDPDSGSGDGMGGSVREFSSSLSQPQRAELIRRCLDTKGHVRVLVSSDGMARGMDLPNVAAVVNYDVPTQVRVLGRRRSLGGGRTLERCAGRQADKEGGGRVLVVLVVECVPSLPAYTEAHAHRTHIHTKKRPRRTCTAWGARRGRGGRAGRCPC